jgi:phage terminase small subunit
MALNEKQGKFVAAYLQNKGSVAEAAKQAGLSRQRGHDLLRDPEIVRELVMEQQRKLALYGVEAISALYRQMHEAESEHVQHSAARELADRAGWGERHNWTSADQRLAEDSPEELLDRIRQHGFEIEFGPDGRIKKLIASDGTEKAPEEIEAEVLE